MYRSQLHKGFTLCNVAHSNNWHHNIMVLHNLNLPYYCSQFIDHPPKFMLAIGLTANHTFGLISCLNNAGISLRCILCW